MKERPIHFNRESVKATVDGRMMQARRVINYDIASQFDLERDGSLEIMTIENNQGCFVPILDYCPYGKAGDQLWVKEAHKFEQIPRAWRTHYLSTDEYMDREMGYLQWHEVANQIKNGVGRNRPSIYMPRWASRIQLEVIGVRVERLQDISEDDACVQGITPIAPGYEDIMYSQLSASGKIVTTREPRVAFEIMWDYINAKRGYSWESNPWVWVVEFSVAKQSAVIHGNQIRGYG